jgi:hypothetical protein
MTLLDDRLSTATKLLSQTFVLLEIANWEKKERRQEERRDPTEK